MTKLKTIIELFKKIEKEENLEFIDGSFKDYNEKVVEKVKKLLKFEEEEQEG